MNPFDFAPLSGLAHGFSPVMAVGAFFPFLKKKKEAASISRDKLLAINHVACHFLEIRGIENFKVYTIAYDEQPVVLIQAVPQKKLRFSNIIEIQIRAFIRDNLSIEVPAVFWRFKTDYSDVPGPEQADYEFDEHPQYPQDRGGVSATAGQTAAENEMGAPAKGNEQENYDLSPRQTLNDLLVKEISMGEFDEFLKGASNHKKRMNNNDQQQ